MGDALEPRMSIARREIEERYGKVGDGGRILFVKGLPMGLETLSRRLALQYKDLVPIDAGAVAGGPFWIRYYDAEARKVMVVEFDAAFDIVGERGADIMDWLGDDYFRVRWRAFCPAGGEEWLGADMAKSGGRR